MLTNCPVQRETRIYCIPVRTPSCARFRWGHVSNMGQRRRDVSEQRKSETLNRDVALLLGLDGHPETARLSSHQSFGASIVRRLAIRGPSINATEFSCEAIGMVTLSRLPNGCPKPLDRVTPDRKQCQPSPNVENYSISGRNVSLILIAVRWMEVGTEPTRIVHLILPLVE